MGQQAAQVVETLADRAHRILRDRLIMLDIAPGAALRDEQIGAEMGVGRTPVREALKRLEGERLVVAYPRQGTFAAEVNLQDLRRLSEVRQELEPLAAHAAAQRATDEERLLLEQVLHTELDAVPARDAGTNRGQIEADLALHRILYAMTHNPYLKDTLHYYGNLNTRIWCTALPHLPDLTGHVAEHREMVAAVVAGQASQAAERMREHVSSFSEFVRQALW